MKKVLFLFIAVLVLISCGSDDSSAPVVKPSIVGSWEVTKRGQLINDIEVFQSHPSDCSTEKDFWYFSANKNFGDIYFDSGCIIHQNENYQQWNLIDNSLLLLSNNSMDFYNVIILNHTTLKVRYQDINGNIIIIQLKRFIQH